MYNQQWHLKNTGAQGGTAGYDLGAETLWALGLKGDNQLIAVVDSAIQLAHPDLRANADWTHSYNYVTKSNDPGPGTATSDPNNANGGCVDDHGTAVAGVIAARDDNGIGIRGLAPRAKIAGLNALAASDAIGSTDDALSNAMVRLQSAGVVIVNNSWGAPDDTGAYAPSGSLWRDAIDQGVNQGRVVGGKALGIVYMFPSGNGGTVSGQSQNSNEDGYANYRNVLTIAAVDHRGRVMDYSEQGANVLVAGYAGGGSVTGTTTSAPGLLTTDVMGRYGANTGSNEAGMDSDYTGTFNGTSGATPTVAAAVALMLQANPNLSWRDVRWLLAKTARAAVGANLEAQTGAMNTHGYSHRVGFGIVDTVAAVNAARASSWTTLPTLRSCTVNVRNVGLNLPDNSSTGLTDQATLTGCGMSVIESVEVIATLDHPYSGDLTLKLTSPSGRVSMLNTTHACASSSDCGYFSGGASWTYSTVRHLGESFGTGVWSLNISDQAPGDVGRWTSWKITVYGH